MILYIGPVGCAAARAPEAPPPAAAAAAIARIDRRVAVNRCSPMAFLPNCADEAGCGRDPARANVRTIRTARLTARFKSEDDRLRASIDAPSSRYSRGAYGVEGRQIS